MSLIRNADNVPQFTIVVCEDITERIRAEQALRESEEKYRTVVEYANEASSSRRTGISGMSIRVWLR